jgi:hypothetical protein
MAAKSIVVFAALVACIAAASIGMSMVFILFDF